MPKTNLSLFIFALVFMVIAGGTAWWITLNANPVAVVPTPTMPVPNAFDDFVAAGDVVVNGMLVANATITSGTSAATPRMQQEAVSLNQKALARFRIGLSKQYWSPPHRSFTATFSYYAKFRSIARLLMVEGKVRASRGDWNGAVQSNLDAMQLGATIPHGGVLIGLLVGLACEAIGRKDLWTNIQHLNAAQSCAAAKRLEAMNRDRFAYSATMQEEKWSTQASLLEMFHQGNLFQLYQGYTGWTGGGMRLSSFNPRFLLYSKRTMFNNVSHALDTAIYWGTLPYYTVSRLPPLPIPPDPISKNENVLPVSEKSRFIFETNETEDVLLETTLALRAYDLEHHAYPATLSQLTPRYLSRIPDDPFAESGPLSYHRINSKYVLYSVGPDGKDDGGRPIAESATGLGRYLQATSTGDIVGGVTVH